ncbi:MAG: flagellar biosynthetic protein FliR [Gammaproteobacteria bacterium]|nr:flagellar biosynthetic protein FliR [Gammaproteobacteria bacterium]
MTIAIETAWIFVIALVALRFGAVLVMTPLFSFGGVPANVRVLLVLALSVLMVSATGIDGAVVPTSVGQMVAAGLSELALGAMLAFGLFTSFAVFQLAGRIIDIQLGFGIASIIDPATRTQSPLLGTFLNLLAIVMFFAIDGHHLLIRGLAFSLEQIPPGTLLTDIDIGAVVAQFGGMFSYALALAAPVLFVILLIDVALSVMARSMPQVNILVVSLPLKIFVGLIILAISLRYIGPLMTRVFENLFDYWHNLMTSVAHG